MQAARAVLFDIDGTLLVTGGAGAVAWQRAFEELYGVEANIEEHTHAGMTDPKITEIVFHEVMGREGSDAERAEVIASYLGHLTDTVAESDGYVVMPGIEELLPRLVEEGILLGVVTGNIESAAHTKLARADLNRFFAFGGYGSDSRDRTELTRKRWSAASRSPASPSPTSRRSPSATPPATSKPATAPASPSSASPPAPTASNSSERPSADWAISDVTDGFPV